MEFSAFRKELLIDLRAELECRPSSGRSVYDHVNNQSSETVFAFQQRMRSTMVGLPTRPAREEELLATEGDIERLDCELTVLSEREPLIQEVPMGDLSKQNYQRDTTVNTWSINLQQAWGARRVIKACVGSWLFDQIACGFVVINAIVIGMQTDFLARHIGEPTPKLFHRIDVGLCVVFSFELALRLGAHGKKFFNMSGWKWNLFDLSMLAFMLFDQACQTLFETRGFILFRLVRLVRLMRIARLLRVVHLVAELRSMVDSIVGSVKALWCALVLLFLVIYVFGVYFTQIVTEQRRHMIHTGDESASMDELLLHCRHLGTTVLALWACVTGGLDWADVMGPLVKETGLFPGIMFCTYIAFVVLAMMNVVTGIFVEEVIVKAHWDQDVGVARSVVNLFKKSELTEKGNITWETFNKKMECDELQQLFSSVGVDPSDAEGVFGLLDFNNSGAVDPTELMNGWIRLKGNARALDLCLLMQETNRMNKDVIHRLNGLANAVSEVADRLMTRDSSRASLEYIKGPRNRVVSVGHATSMVVEEPSYQIRPLNRFSRASFADKLI